MTAYKDFPFPEGSPLFPDHRQVRQYLEQVDPSLIERVRKPMPAGRTAGLVQLVAMAPSSRPSALPQAFFGSSEPPTIFPHRPAGT